MAIANAVYGIEMDKPQDQIEMANQMNRKDEKTSVEQEKWAFYFRSLSCAPSSPSAQNVNGDRTGKVVNDKYKYLSETQVAFCFQMLLINQKNFNNAML